MKNFKTSIDLAALNLIELSEREGKSFCQVATKIKKDNGLFDFKTRIDTLPVICSLIYELKS